MDGDDDIELHQLAMAMDQLAEKKGLRVHVMGNGAIITTPRTDKTGHADAGDDAQEDALLEGEEALPFFMNVNSSDCLIIIGAHQLHASSGEEGRHLTATHNTT